MTSYDCVCICMHIYTYIQITISNSKLYCWHQGVKLWQSPPWSFKPKRMFPWEWCKFNRAHKFKKNAYNMKSCGKVRNNDSMPPQKMGQGTINQKNKYLENSKCKQRTIVLSFSKWEHWGSLVMEKQQEKQVCSQTHKAGSHLRGTLYCCICLDHFPHVSLCVHISDSSWLLDHRAVFGIHYQMLWHLLKVLSLAQP